MKEAKIVVELKAVKALEHVHFAVVRSYLWATGREHRLSLNFAKPPLESSASLPPNGHTMASWLPGFLASWPP